MAAGNAPKYQTIKNYLIEGIKSRSFTDAVPSENQLAEQFGVSRMTARRALSDLEREGSVERIPGKGTFVRKREHFTRGFFRVRPFRKWAEDLHAALTTRALEAKIIPAPEKIAKFLKGCDQVVFLRILNYLDGKPVRYAVHYLLADQCAGLLMEDLERESIHDLLINKCNLPLTKISQSMTAIGLPREIARLFDAAPGSPFFYFERITYSFDRPVSFVEYYMRGDMAFKDTFTPDLDQADFSRTADEEAGGTP